MKNKIVFLSKSSLCFVSNWALSKVERMIGWLKSTDRGLLFTFSRGEEPTLSLDGNLDG